MLALMRPLPIMPLARKRPRSQMWEHFELIGPNRLQCLLCPQQLSYNNNTSSMMRHFKAKHDGILETDYDKKHDLDQALVNLVVKDSQPCSIVEDRGFRDFVKKLDPSYALPSKQALKKMVDDRYQEEKADAQAQLREAEAVSLTVDLWTSADTRLAVACHYVLENSKLATVLLGVLPFPQNHGPTDVADAQRTLMAEWGLEGKVKCLVSDTTPAMVAAADDLALPHVECIAHALNGVVRRALDKTAGLKGLRRRAGEVVALFRSSAAAKEKLRSKQQKLALPVTKLVREESSRWTSTFLMLQSLLDARRAVGSALTALGAKVEPLSCDESETSAACLQVLKPFYTATVEMSEQKRVLGSMGIPLVKMLLLATEEVAEESDNVTAELLGQNLSAGLRREFDGLEENPVLSLATLLDPRFKTIGFRCQEKAQQAVQTLTAECAALVRPAADRPTERPAQQTSTAFNLWKSLDDQASMVRTHSNATADATLEVQRYMTDPPLERSQDPLVYWKEHKNIYPHLFSLAKKHLCIPASSVPFERVFSKAGDVFSRKRNRLSPKAAEKILLLNKNI
ncbi:zinc finger BED domain-containing protein 4 isoform X2 [Oryzias latipes]|uniref:zinc finger BED domain-containing protein 4 isoform X2 n=1 Tax=Oryzias latipes TaxID=8090 RepID=UPI000CE20045|nr:zinc finger BED domain-containing protein 4 isoform X2 [Oryzias latipes]